MPACGGPLRKKFGTVGISFKGTGFYKTDSRGRRPAPRRNGQLVELDERRRRLDAELVGTPRHDLVDARRDLVVDGSRILERLVVERIVGHGLVTSVGFVQVIESGQDVIQGLTAFRRRADTGDAAAGTSRRASTSSTMRQTRPSWT